MKGNFVVDASVALAWCFKDEATQQTRELLRRAARETLAAPTIFFLEVANTLVVAKRKGRIDERDAIEFVGTICDLDWQIDPVTANGAFNELLPLAVEHKLTVYDASYLLLAMQEDLPLATLDTKLRVAAKSAGVELLGLD